MNRKKSRKDKSESELPMYNKSVELVNLEDYGRTTSRDNLLSGTVKRSWRRNYVNTTPP